MRRIRALSEAQSKLSFLLCIIVNSLLLDLPSATVDGVAFQ